MSADALLTVENLSKKFCRNLKQSLWYGMKDIAGEFARRNRNSGRLRAGEFWALDGLSFTLKRGDCLGLIGANGSGKSTLLKLINGLIKPDRGRIAVSGKVGALIELGTGFNPILTGRENIYVNGSVLGMTKRQIEDKIDSIIAFSEIGEHIDSPVQNYSSGMKVRLGFAVAAQLNPDILLIDEVLSVGDIGFRAKCINKIDRIQRNAAVVFVSHHMSQVARICTHIVVLDRGRVAFQGRDVTQGIERYYDQFGTANTGIFGSGRAKIQKIHVYADGRRQTDGGAVKIDCRDDLFIELTFTLEPEIRHPVINVAFFSKDMRNVAQCYSSNCDFAVNNSGEVMTVRLHLPNIPFNPGIYNISVTMLDERRGEVLTRHEAAVAVQVVGSFMGNSAIQLQGHWTVL